MVFTRGCRVGIFHCQLAPIENALQEFQINRTMAMCVSDPHDLNFAQNLNS